MNTQDATDIAAIQQVIYRYCRAMDRLDPDLLRTVFHADAEIDLGAIYRGGVDGFIPVAVGFMSAMVQVRHEVSNTIVSLHGDEAEAESYVHSWHRIARNGAHFELVVLGRYLDRLARRDGRWAIVRRAEVIDWGVERETSPAWFENNSEMPKGVRGSEDLSYTLLPRLAGKR